MTDHTLGPLPEPTQGLGSHRWSYSGDDMRAYALAEVARAVEEERERCAKVCEAEPILGRTDQEALGFSHALEVCAAAIRGA